MSEDAFLSRFLALAAVVFALSGPVSAEGTEISSNDDPISFDMDDDTPNRNIEPSVARMEDWDDTESSFSIVRGGGDS